MNKNSTKGYQYKATDGSLFNSREDKEYYLEQQAEKREAKRDEQYRDQQDRIPAWKMYNENNDEWECSRIDLIL
jgi:hypothetical protein